MLFSFSLSPLPPLVSIHQGRARKVMMLKPEKVRSCNNALFSTWRIWISTPETEKEPVDGIIFSNRN